MIATQNHSQVKMLFLLDFLCDNLMHPCNTPSRAVGAVPTIPAMIWSADRSSVMAAGPGR
jgi:hypothetical protein